ncbi:uncharacterized protein LOC141761341 [Sebastes fasciatus]|uniref:uncharacterized protein LOC141761341 n=1 Tax=Sebastes fasciatus TaxID=394691 RepID=UPI003D9F1062
MKLVINSSFKMLPQRTGLSLQSPLRPLSVLVFHLLLTHSLGGQSQMIGLSQPIVALVGDDIILPCHLEPAEDVSAMTLEWTRPDLNSIAVFVWRAGKDLVHVKDPSYTGRTSLFTDGLKHGNISLKLSKVKLSDEGRYQCYVADLSKGSLVELVVASGAASYPVITLSGINEATRGVMLDCRSEGWYPEPEVLWLDGEGNLLSAGPPETVRGPDDLYTVSSRVTVEKRHSNSFTCRVQQKKTNQTREAHISISNDFFNVQSSSVHVITGLAVSLAVWIIMFILLLLFVLWKWRLNRIKTKRNCRDQTEKGEKKNCSETNKTVDQCVTEERERETLMPHETVEMEVLKGNGQKKSKHFKKKRSEQQLQEEQKKEVQTLKEELQTKKIEIETKGAELQQLHEEKKRNDNELQSLKEELENKELERTRNTRSIFSLPLSPSQEDQQKKEVETLKKKLENQQKESDANIKEFEDKEAEVQQLQDQIQRMETNLQTQMESNNMELERSRAAPVRSSSSGFKWQIVSRQKIQDEQQRRHESENRVQTLEEEMKTKNRELQDEQHRRHQAEPEVQMKGNELQDNTSMLKGNQADIHSQLLQETQRRKDAQREVEKLKNDLESQKKEFNKQLYDEQQKKQQGVEKDPEELVTKNLEMEDKSSSASQSSTTEPLIVVEVNQKGKNIHLINKSHQDQPLGGWRCLATVVVADF